MSRKPERRWTMAGVRAGLYIDCGPPDATTLIAGMGRSGTTWVAQLLNHDRSSRVLFEPFRPAVVPEADVFEYIQYLRPEFREPAHVLAAQQIIAGRVRNPAVDQGNRGFLFRRRIVKEIRCNLMLRWISGICPGVPVVLVVRHPLAVAASWLRLGWGTEAHGTRTDFEIITAQSQVMLDFPELRALAAEIDAQDPFERTVFEWCAFHLVPVRQFPAGRLFIVHYENLLAHPERELQRLFAHVGRGAALRGPPAAFWRPSESSFPTPGPATPRDRLHGWQDQLTQARVQRAQWMLTRCGLDTMYSASQPMPREVS